MSQQPSKPNSPEWLVAALERLNFVLVGDAEVTETSRGYCCLKHELEFGPVELELFRVSLPLPPGSDRESGKRIYDVIVQEAKSAAKHKVAHMLMDQDGFLLALTPYKKPRPWKKSPA